MDDENTIGQTKQFIRDFYVPSRDKIELLQSILEFESGGVVSFEEAEEVGIQLISLYECLAGTRTITQESADDAI